MAGRNNRPVMTPAANPQPASPRAAPTPGLVQVTFIRDHQHANIDYVADEIAHVSPEERELLLRFGAIAPPAGD